MKESKKSQNCNFWDDLLCTFDITRGVCLLFLGLIFVWDEYDDVEKQFIWNPQLSFGSLFQLSLSAVDANTDALPAWQATDTEETCLSDQGTHTHIQLHSEICAFPSKCQNSNISSLCQLWGRLYWTRPAEKCFIISRLTHWICFNCSIKNKPLSTVIIFLSLHVQSLS